MKALHDGHPLVGRLFLERGLDGGELLRVVSVKADCVIAYAVSPRAAHVRELALDDVVKFYAIVPKTDEHDVYDVHITTSSSAQPAPRRGRNE